jgi:mannose-6-phosphate isomerase-like protein (cupin superfamily)
MHKPVRRVVTGLDKNSRSRVLSDGPSPHVTEGPSAVITEIWSSSESPAAYDFKGDRAIFPMKHDPYSNGTICRLLEMKPGVVLPDLPVEELLKLSQALFQGMQSDFEPTLDTVRRHPSFHKTDSLDYLVMLSGRLTMLMDDDEEVTLESGDVVVQQGVLHGWRVEGDEPVRIFAVLVDGQSAG